MIEQLLKNIPNMRNDEIIGLAKNRFLPGPLQLAIAKHNYRRAHMYLCENAGLSKEARDYLWSDACNRGYTNKCSLLQHGHYDDQPEKYAELYNKQGRQMYNRSPWRANATFVRSHYWQGARQSQTPSELLNKIYDNHFSAAVKANKGNSGYNDYYYSSRHSLRDLARHQNCDLPLAIKLSTCGVQEVESDAFKKIVELSK